MRDHLQQQQSQQLWLELGGGQEQYSGAPTNGDTQYNCIQIER